MEELHKPLIFSRGGPIAPTTIQQPEFVLKNYMIERLQQNCQFYGFQDEDANNHLNKYLSITQFIKKNRVSEDIANLNLFPFSLTHEAESWFYRLKTHSIHTWEEMVSKFLSKYYPYSKALQLRRRLKFLAIALGVRPGHPCIVNYSYYDESDEDEPLEANKLEMDLLIREPSNTFLMGDEEIKLNSLKDIVDLVLVPRVFEKPLDSLDPISKTFDQTITTPLFDFNSEFTLNSDNPIFEVRYEDSDESKTEIIMDEVQINSSQSTAQIPTPYGKLPFDMTMPSPILTLS
ncbi:reverse transcriptase domain-containing protein [Tanacetum coccineum]